MKVVDDLLVTVVKNAVKVQIKLCFFVIAVTCQRVEEMDAVAGVQSIISYKELLS